MIKVSNIERFATHDGPGIRTTVFLKGCPLHCPWCANPETWQVNPVLMHDEKKCAKCHMCMNVCPSQAISFQPDFTLNKELCTNCQKCEEECLNDAISFSGKEMSCDQIYQEIQKDDLYYKQSHGGVTLSGGEPLFQFEESFSLIQYLKQKDYHIALETTGMYDHSRLVKVEPYVDLFLHDLKHIDSTKLKEFTGADFKTIDENLTYLSKSPEKVIIRIPVIPKFNDDVLKEMILYAKEKGFKEVHLLPYHSLGKNKWHNLKKQYQYEQEAMMDKSSLSEYVTFGKENNMIVKLGG